LRDEVDLDAGILAIRDTKFGKSRIVPIHPTTVAVLADYAKRRDEQRFAPISPTFFIGEQGRPLNYGAIILVFWTVSRQIGLLHHDSAVDRFR